MAAKNNNETKTNKFGQRTSDRLDVMYMVKKDDLEQPNSSNKNNNNENML